MFSTAPAFISGTQEVLGNGMFRSQLRTGEGRRLIVRSTEDFVTFHNLSTNEPPAVAPILFTDTPEPGSRLRFYQAIVE